jgi:DnaJ family protein C protein 3
MVLLKPLFSAALLFTTTLANPDSSLPVSSLLASADALLAQGDKHGALSHFDAAVAKDPSNYLTLFKRGATYLSLGRSSQASADFDAALELKPDFKAALLQRAGLKAKTGEWEKAKEDYSKGGKQQEREEVERAERAATLVKEAEDKGDWETCVEQAGVAIAVGSQVLGLRQSRARCRLMKGDLPEAVGDLM